MKKTVALFLTLALALTLAVSALAEPVTLTYAHVSGAGAQEETLKKMIAVFEEKNPDIKVDVQITGFDNYFTKLATTVGGNNAPDVFEMNMENFLAYMLRGACADLTGLVNAENYSAGTLEAVSSDGKLYAVDVRMREPTTDELHVEVTKKDGQRGALPSDGRDGFGKDVRVRLCKAEGRQLGLHQI